MTVKTILKWLDTLTAWGFVIGLACQAYDLFMVQSPARFRVFGQGEMMGDFTGVLQIMTPYLACLLVLTDAVQDHPLTVQFERHTLR